MFLGFLIIRTLLNYEGAPEWVWKLAILEFVIQLPASIASLLRLFGV